MFKLLKVSQGMFRIIHTTAGVDYEDTADKTFAVMRSLGVKDEETKMALDDMEAKGTNCADFGIGLGAAPGEARSPMFIYSIKAHIEYATIREIRVVEDVKKAAA